MGVKISNRLRVGLAGALDEHHILLDSRGTHERRLPSSEAFERRYLLVGFRGGTVEATGRPDGGGKLKLSAIDVYVENGANIDVQHVEDVMTRGVTTFSSAQAGILTTLFCSGASGAVFLRRMPALSQNMTSLRLANCPPLSMRRHT